MVDEEQFRQQNLANLYENVMDRAAKEREAHQKAYAVLQSARKRNLTVGERVTFLQGTAWQRQQEWEPHVRDVYKANPVLEEAIIYFMQRQSMNNPKDWAHVLRTIERAKPEDFDSTERSKRTTQEEYDEAVATLRQWVVADKVDAALREGKQP